MKIKDKTVLRREILERKDNTGLWDYLELYSDGTWIIRDHSTFSPSAISRRRISGILYDNDCHTCNEAITQYIQEMKA